MIWIIKSFLEGQEDSFCKWSGSSDPFWRDRMIDWIQYLFLQRVYIIIIKPSSLMQQGYIFCKSLINFGRRFDYENDGDCNNCHHHFWSSLSQHRPWWKVAANASDCVGQNLAQPLEVEDHEGQTHLGRGWWWWFWGWWWWWPWWKTLWSWQSEDVSPQDRSNLQGVRVLTRHLHSRSLKIFDFEHFTAASSRSLWTSAVI